MRRFVVLLVSVLVLAGCSAAGLKKAEEKTRLAGAVNPLGALIHLPLWVASTVANLGSGSDNDDEPALAPPEASEERTVEKGQPD